MPYLVLQLSLDLKSTAGTKVTLLLLIATDFCYVLSVPLLMSLSLTAVTVATVSITTHCCHIHTAWKESRTGYPFIDAVMTQLRTEGWIHHLARYYFNHFNFYTSMR